MTILIICKDKKGWVLGSDTYEIDGKSGRKIKNSKFMEIFSYLTEMQKFLPI